MCIIDTNKIVLKLQAVTQNRWGLVVKGAMLTCSAFVFLALVACDRVQMVQPGLTHNLTEAGWLSVLVSECPVYCVLLCSTSI